MLTDRQVLTPNTVPSKRCTAVTAMLILRATSETSLSQKWWCSQGTEALRTVPFPLSRH